MSFGGQFKGELVDATQEQIRRRRTGTRTLAIGAVTASVAMVATALIAPVASADDKEANSVSAAHGHLLWADGLGLDIAGAGSTTTEWTAAGPNAEARGDLDVSALNAIDLGVPGLTLPIVKENAGDPGLLWLGAAGALESYSLSEAENRSFSASGLIGSDGRLDLTAIDNAPGENARIDLTDLLDQLQLSQLTDDILDQASIELGALGAQAEKDGTAVDREYALAELELTLRSQALDDVTGAVDGVVGGVGTTLDGLLGEGGAVHTAVSGLVFPLLNGVLAILGGGAALDLSVDTTGLVDSVRTELLQAPIDNESSAGAGDASVTIDLSSGIISVDLEQLLVGPNGPYAGQSLSSLPANTDLLTDEVLGAIVSGVTNALTGAGPNSLTSTVDEVVRSGLYSLGITIDLRAGVGGLLGTLHLTVEDSEGGQPTLGGILGIDGYNSVNWGQGPGNGGVIGLVGALLSGLLQSLDNVLGSIGGILDTQVIQPVLGNLGTALDAALQPLITTLLGGADPLLKQVLDGVIGVTINEQPDQAPLNTNGDFGSGSYTVRALSLTVLPVLGSDAVGVQLGSATVLAADEESPENSADARAAASASASASADDDSNASAQAAAQAAAYGDQSSQASAQTEADASAAAQAAAQASVEAGASTNASQDASTQTNASAQAAAEGGTADNSTDSKASASTSAQATANANASAQAAASSDAYSVGSADASANAGASSSASTNTNANTSTNADASNNASADANANASASASADSNANAAAKAAAMADNTTSASAQATANAQAAAQAAANQTASTSASAQANGSAQAAAQAAAHSQADSDSNASASAQANSNASAAAKAAAIANASSNASGDNPNPNTSKCVAPRTRSVFLDTPTNHKFYKEIDWMHCMGYTTGIKRSGGIDYGPQLRLSREAMAAFIFRMEAPKSYQAPAVSPFADMKPGDKFYREIAWMYEAGLSTGIKNPAGGKPNYGPKLRLSREAMAAFIYRLEAPSGYTAPAKSQMLDMKRGDKFYTEISWMVDEQLSTGIKVEDGREFWPKSRLSREAMAAFIYRLVNSYRA